MNTPSHPAYLIVIGTSAGGLPALVQLVQQLPATLPAAVLVVQHLATDSSGAHIVHRLSQHTSLSCQLATDQLEIKAGHLYLAPPDRHLLIQNQQLLVTKGPRENSYRPAVDALFRSAAVHYGSAVIGVVLTGMLHDGTAGLDIIKRCSGRAVVQDPQEADYPSMPETALRNVAIDHILPLNQMGHLLQQMTSGPPPTPVPIPDDILAEAAIAERVVGTISAVQHIGAPMPFTCPDCGGALWKLEHGNVLRFRCHTGHAFTAEALLDSSRQSLEESLWVALRMMEERKNLLSSMTSREQSPWNAQQQERLEEIKRHINRLREFMLNGVNGLGPAGSNDLDSALH
jgi:two-component system chemotaxis response regulator CheB